MLGGGSWCCIAGGSRAGAALLPVRWRRQLTASRGRHLAPYAGAAVPVPGPLRPAPPSSRDVNEVGCAQQMLEAGASSLPAPRPAVAARRWGRLCQHFLGHRRLSLVVSSCSCSEPFVDTGTGSPGAGPGLALSSASGETGQRTGCPSSPLSLTDRALLPSLL